MQTWLSLADQHSAYFSFMLAALCSFFFSLPQDLNPLSAFALIFQQIAKKINLPERTDGYKRLASIFAFTIIYSPIALITSQLYVVAFQPAAIDFIILFVLLSWHDKTSLFKLIIIDLKKNRLAEAKQKLSQLTLRETKPLSLIGTNKATIEAMVLQLANSWFSVVFWYLIGGIYAAFCYQLIAIMAQQWNYKLSIYQPLGEIPSLLIKLMQFPTHLILGFTFSLYDHPIRNLLGKFKQSLDWHHFSSGLLLSSFAVSMHIQLGGVRIYAEEKTTYAHLGFNTSPSVKKVALSLRRISLSAWFWLICITGYEFLPNILSYFVRGYSV